MAYKVPRGKGLTSELTVWEGKGESRKVTSEYLPVLSLVPEQTFSFDTGGVRPSGPCPHNSLRESHIKIKRCKRGK